MAEFLLQAKLCLSGLNFFKLMVNFSQLLLHRKYITFKESFPPYFCIRKF